MALLDDDEFELLLNCVAINMACTAVAVVAVKRVLEADVDKPKRKHRLWVNKYLKLRPQFGAYNSLMKDILELDSVKFQNFRLHF